MPKLIPVRLVEELPDTIRPIRRRRREPETYEIHGVYLYARDVSLFPGGRSTNETRRFI